MGDDSELLKIQLDVNDERLQKLGEHKKSVELQLKSLESEKDREFLLEIMKRLDHNLQIENKHRDGILKALSSKNQF
jgi:DNA integrity scanning protein DisA with diadenylate cyclase activity